MSIRFRLTLLYTAILGVTLVAFALFVYALLTRNLVLQIDNELTEVASATARVPRVLGGGGPANAGANEEREAIGRILASRNGTLPPTSPAPDVYIQYVDGGGNVVARSSALASADLTLPVPRARLSHRSLSTVRISDQNMRLLREPLAAGPSGGGTLELARSLSDVEATLSHLRVVLALGVVGALVLAGATGLGLATLALQPIDRLTQAAHEIGEAQDFSRRVSYAGPGDEVGRLAGTFNEMLTRLQASYARIQRALEAQRRFVADASHELRTPLTTIRGNVELLQLEEDSESAERREALHDIASEAERMSRLVADLLALARADAGLHIQRNAVEIRPLVEEVCRQVRRTSGDIRVELGSIPDASVSGSADHLKQLLLILLDNARKFSPPGSTIFVSGALARGWLRLSVRDEGPGIPEEDQGRIFERFHRQDVSRHGEGAGLGLAIARWIATEHDGRLTVESVPGKGSTFTLAVPL
ncbi:MAG TPA: HAMP domain-containing sensor histidine kinase, partial [Dehalococcoidia bacterium]|nr:HAMP domain-containing sensor histidine kinase [Dehalococcoidia bacterium]